MKIDSLQRMLDFLALLQETGTQYRIDQHSPEALTVTLSLVGHRIEVEFSVQGMQYSIFRGNESVEVDEKPLLDLIRKLSQ